MEITVRSYQPQDAAACRACVLELREAERSLDPRLESGERVADRYLTQMHERCRDYAGSLFVAERAAEVVGLILVLARVPFDPVDEPPGDYALVAELVVRASHRGQGIGRALLREGERFARESRATELRLKVLSANGAARDLYVAEGFTPYSEVLSKELGRAATQ